MSNMKIALVGNIALDVTTFIGDNVLDESLENCNVDDISTCIGGCIINHGKAMIANGINPQIISLFSDDLIGDLLKKEMNSHGLSSKCIFPLLKENNRTVLIVKNDGNKFMFSKRAMLPKQDIIEDRIIPELIKYDFIHFSLNNWTKEIVKKIHNHNPNISLSTDLHLDIDMIDAKIISHMKIVFFSGANDNNPIQTIYRILSMGAEIVICTNGKDGCLVGEKNLGIEKFEAINQSKPIIDTVGAGDIFAATFLSEFYNGIKIEDAILKATIQAGDSCTKLGLDKLMNKKELDSEMDKYL